MMKLRGNKCYKKFVKHVIDAAKYICSDASANKEDLDMKSLFLMQAISNGQSFGSNSVNGVNPMILLALSDKNDKSNDIFTTMALMQMMNSGNSLFGTPVTTSTTTNPTV